MIETSTCSGIKFFITGLDYHPFSFTRAMIIETSYGVGKLFFYHYVLPEEVQCA